MTPPGKIRPSLRVFPAARSVGLSFSPALSVSSNLPHAVSSYSLKGVSPLEPITIVVGVIALGSLFLAGCGGDPKGDDHAMQGGSGGKEPGTGGSMGMGGMPGSGGQYAGKADAEPDAEAVLDAGVADAEVKRDAEVDSAVDMRMKEEDAEATDGAVDAAADIGVDASLPDAEIVLDAGPEDAGVEADAAVEIYAADAWIAPDTAPPEDAGLAEDVSVPDAADAGVVEDAGVVLVHLEDALLFHTLQNLHLQERKPHLLMSSGKAQDLIRCFQRLDLEESKLQKEHR